MPRAGVVILGSNSTRMLTADGTKSLTNPVRGRVETQLFMGLSPDGLLRKDVMERAAQSAGTLCRQARSAGAEKLFILATSAARDARNTQDLAQAVRSLCGAEMWVISGQMEALYAYLGAVSALDDPGSTGVIDLGGGSAEVIWGRDGAIIFSRSVQMGAARLNMLRPIHTPGDVAPALEIASEAVRNVPWPDKKPERWLLVGGTGSALKDIALGLSAASPVPDTLTVARDIVVEQLMRFAAATPGERALVPGLPRGREHIYPTGLAVLLSLMDVLGIVSITVTLRNNTDGFLYWYASSQRTSPDPQLPHNKRQ